MAKRQSLFLQKTALDVQITYKNAAIQTPIPLNIGNAADAIMDITLPNPITQYEMTATGDTSVALLPGMVSGKIHLHPQSPSLHEIARVVDLYYSLNIIIPGVISFISKSGNFSYIFSNVVFKTPFIGYNATKVLEDYIYEFDANLPDNTSISNLLNSLAGIINVV